MAARGRIAAKFAELKRRGQVALIPFIVAGDPDLDHTEKLVLEMESRGADIVELGVPFSDPMADGPANQRALARGLASNASLTAILALVAKIREHSQIPIVLFGYYNPFFRYGCERLARDAKDAGVDGILAVDLPQEESADLGRPAHEHGVDLIYLLAPTTPLERSRKIARTASGFLYYVSVTGITGTRDRVAEDVEDHVRALRGLTNLPIGVGFGISRPEQAAEVARFADAVVVGSALSLIIEKHGRSDDLLSAVGDFIAALKAGMTPARTPAEATASK